MWHVVTKEQEEAQKKQIEEQVKQIMEEGRRKAEAKENWLRAYTCPHCNQHPPLPPWLM